MQSNAKNIAQASRRIKPADNSNGQMQNKGLHCETADLLEPPKPRKIKRHFLSDFQCRGVLGVLGGQQFHMACKSG